MLGNSSENPHHNSPFPRAMEQLSNTSSEPVADLTTQKFETEYRSIKENPALQFYMPCLQRSTHYKRAVGYFRSSVYLVVGPSIIEFARRGGKIRLICSPELSQEDVDCIAAGYGKRSEILSRSLTADIDRMLASEKTSYPLQVLATLVSAGALDIKVALRADRKGIYHEKIGIFVDRMGNKVSFKGSTNESWNGWHSEGNFESIEVFCSWRGGLEAERIAKHEAHFDELWSENDKDVEVFAFPDSAMSHLRKATLSVGIDKVEAQSMPPSALTRIPLPHQTSALKAWANQNYRGILEHATGAGKTFTAILAILEHTSQSKPCIVLVPSLLLLEQWADEIQSELPRVALLIAGGGHTRWRHANRLQGMTADDPTLGGRIILATMHTGASREFMSQICFGPHILVVADEVHQIGSPYNSQFLNGETGRRLGLSATPQRYGDPEGTAKLIAYFGGVVSPTITLFDAIKAGRLVEYEYFPRSINLTATEAEEWRSLSLAIRQEMAKQKEDANGNRALSERAKMMLIRRARVAKKAAKKIEIAVDIIKNEYKDGQHWLIYCEDAEQLGEVVQALRGIKLSPIEYHTSMAGDRTATMAWFRAFGGLLVSIRCLDEGVDIPAVSHALILASSQNPRQFIQRRGRVLRKSYGKHFASIHDVVVVPVDLENEPEQTSLLKSEMLRAIEFADNAVNKMASAELRSVCARLGINPDEISDSGIEDETEDGE